MELVVRLWLFIRTHKVLFKTNLLFFINFAIIAVSFSIYLTNIIMKKYLNLIRSNKSGYTFVELLVVIVIMAVLVAASANYLFAQGGSKARDTERKSEIKQIAALVEQFVAAYGEPPNPSVKNRKVQNTSWLGDCKSVKDYKSLMKCFKALKYIGGEGLEKLTFDPKEEIENEQGKVYNYMYAADNNGWKICSLLENQTDPDLNANYEGKKSDGISEGERTYCVVATNRRLNDIDDPVLAGSDIGFLED